MKRYRGVRDEDGARVCVFYQDTRGIERRRPLRLVQPRHSSEFNWSYGGSGPSELARQLLRDVFGSGVLEQPWLYQRFKADYVTGWGDTWEIGEAEIRAWAAQIGTSWPQPEVVDATP